MKIRYILFTIAILLVFLCMPYVVDAQSINLNATTLRTCIMNYGIEKSCHTCTSCGSSTVGAISTSGVGNNAYKTTYTLPNPGPTITEGRKYVLNTVNILPLDVKFYNGSLFSHNYLYAYIELTYADGTFIPEFYALDYNIVKSSAESSSKQSITFLSPRTGVITSISIKFHFLPGWGISGTDASTVPWKYTSYLNIILNTDSNMDDLKQSQDKTNDFLTDDTPPDSDISGLGNVSGIFPPGPVDSLLNIPFQFLSMTVSSFGGTCSPINTKLLTYDVSIPCYREILYSDKDELYMNLVGLVPAAFILISYFKHLYKKIDRATSMQSNSDDEWGVI